VLDDKRLERRFGIDGYAVGIEVTRQAAGIHPAVDVGYLGCGKSDNVIGFVVAEVHIEVVKIAPCGAKDNNFFTFHWAPPPPLYSLK
jgi:hypothetical protein